MSSNMATSTEIEEFLKGPLVTWLLSCLSNPDRLSDYEDLADGIYIHEVYLLIDPEPVHQSVVPSLRNASVRIKNFNTIVKNIKSLYEEELCQIVLVLPDVLIIGREPESKQGLENMKLLLLLLLGCAVQCPNKETFIERIKELPVESQHALVDCIKQVTENQDIVLSLDNCEGVPTEVMVSNVKALAKERDRYLQTWRLVEEKRNPSIGNSECQHLAVELADLKSKLRKQRLELEEKSEHLTESRDELEHHKALINRMKAEMLELRAEARSGKAYRDEVDALRERAERCDRLESEIQRYKDKLTDLEYYKSRVEELRQDNRVLDETREMLEEQLAKARKRGDHTLELESTILQYKQAINEIALERDANAEKLQQLIEENTNLSLLSKSNQCVDNQSVSSVDLNDLASPGSGDNSLSEQLTSSAQAKALRLELENKRLLSTIESLHENAFYESGERILELEKEKKKLSLQVEDLEETKRRLSAQCTEYESKFTKLETEIRKINESYQNLELQIQVRNDELDNMNREKQKLEWKNKELELNMEINKQLSNNTEEINEYKTKLANCEKEIKKCKEALESKAESLDKLTNKLESMEKEHVSLTKQIEDQENELKKYNDLKREMDELDSKYQVDKNTLSVLQNDLVNEKLKTTHLKNSLDKLGLAMDDQTDAENILEKILSSPEILNAVKKKLGVEHFNDESSLNNAKLEVDLKTSQSQISSLTSQHTALQLANSQLVAEKEELAKELKQILANHNELLQDQMTMTKLHEQLNMEYESVVKEIKVLKSTLRDVKNENKTVKEQYSQLKVSYESLQAEMEQLKFESHSLSNLRAEHSKLKDDFRILFTANEKLKADFRALQEEHKGNHMEKRKLTLSLTELEGELANRDDAISALSVQLSKYQNKLEMATKMNANLEDDRRKLMEHVTNLLAQYHELLTHSLEDKDHYHEEEKNFSDKLNNLHRQKEKLEEKIMEHYRKLDSCSSSSKKKSFGANLVRKVRKAGSELINKSRKSWHEDSLRKDRGTDSDTSLEDVRSKQGDLETPGTRRTLYYSGDEHASNKKPTTQEPGSMLVYNRLTAVLGSPTSSPYSSNVPPATEPSQAGLSMQPPVNNPVWYEYGCV
ncbi:hypothetical protein M8J75_007897 [Diaphorina citri]|nr:hypothetical protein M8J75_007897 [Diaphorina citri]